MSSAKSTVSIDLSDFIRKISDRIGGYNKPESLSQWCKQILRESRPEMLQSAHCMRSRVSQKLNKVETLEGFSLMEKLQLVFIFSCPVSDKFVQILKEAKIQIEQDGENRISQFSSENGSVVRFSDHHPGVKFFEGVLCPNNRFQKYVNKKRMTQEEDEIQQEADNENPGPEVPQIREEPVENIPIETKQEEMGVEEEPIGNITMKQEPNQEEDDTLNIGQDVRQPAFNGRINYDELDEQEFVYPGFPQNIKIETFVGPQKRRQSSTKVGGKRLKTEEMESAATSSNSPVTSSIKKTVTVENDGKTPDASSSLETTSNDSAQPPPPEARATIKPDEQKISVLELATHIERIASHYELESLQMKASIAMEKMKKMGDKNLSVKKFNVSISFMLILLEENIAHKDADSIELKSLLKNIRSFLIRPMGSQVINEALKSIDQKIEEFKDKNDEFSFNYKQRLTTDYCQSNSYGASKVLKSGISGRHFGLLSGPRNPRFGNFGRAIIIFSSKSYPGAKLF
ncbi:hypothetical protein B9Z55_021248 [Caenorhabditis nigoni]|uniref:SPK domain-containing protein n=1 Tax=Caenorhabditis nigoni TaxID=1611254 RepID=A0A2G5TR12_9PELO|nr:hypothetical protein B9Z55_021248 [Caenorhabditis nigoni]